MPHFGAVPFTLKRSSDLWESNTYTWTTEIAHGLVRLESDRLVIQWRTAIKTESMGSESWSTTEDFEPVREIVIPLRDVAGAAVRQPWWRFFMRPRLVITAADLLAFEKVAGEEGLKLKHPAKLELRIKHTDRLAAEEFAAELALAVAQLPRGDASDASLPGPDAHGPIAIPAPDPEAES